MCQNLWKLFSKYTEKCGKIAGIWCYRTQVSEILENFVNRNFRMRLKNRPTEIDRTWLHVPSGTLGPPAVTLTKWYKCWRLHGKIQKKSDFFLWAWFWHIYYFGLRIYDVYRISINEFDRKIKVNCLSTSKLSTLMSFHTR